MEYDKEEGEMSDDAEMIVDEERRDTDEIDTKCTVVCTILFYICSKRQGVSCECV